MNDLLWIGPAVTQRRLELGLTQTALAQLAGISRATVNGLERGQLNNLSLGRLGQLLKVVGLKLQYDRPRIPHENILAMVAQICSVSFTTTLTAQALRDALSSGDILKKYEAHLITFVDELPIPVIVNVVEAVALNTGISPSKIWKHLGLWATTFNSTREELNGL
jgi:transcriptional regulator with XRE-family HTH domain